MSTKIKKMLDELRRWLQPQARKAGVVEVGSLESEEEAIARALEQGRQGPFLIVPERLDPEDWDRAAAGSRVS